MRREVSESEEVPAGMPGYREIYLIVSLEGGAMADRDSSGKAAPSAHGSLDQAAMVNALSGTMIDQRLAEAVRAAPPAAPRAAPVVLSSCQAR